MTNNIALHIVIAALCFLTMSYFFKKISIINSSSVYPLHYLVIAIIALVPIINTSAAAVVFLGFLFFSMSRVWNAFTFPITDDMKVIDIFKQIIKRYKEGK